MWRLALDPAVMAEPQYEIYTLFCVVLGEENPFSIDIAKNKTVDHLKKQIKKEKQPKLDHIAADELTLYHIEVTDDDNMADNVKQRMSDQKGRPSPLKSTKNLKSYFAATPREETIHIVVQIPDQGPRGSKRKASLSLLEIDNGTAAKRVRVLVDPNADCSPSQFGLTRYYKRLDPTKFAFNRPPLPETVPLTILDPIFGQFVEETHTHEPTATDDTLVQELRMMMSKSYANERIYCDEFRTVLSKRYPDVQLMAAEIGSTKYTSDGHLSQGQYMYSVCEGKTWNGDGDPEVQAAGYFNASLRHRFKKQGDYPDRFPCMIIYLVGPLICFAGAVLTDRLQLETLTLPLAMHISYHDEEIPTQAARTLGAFRHAVQKLQRHCSKLVANDSPTSFTEAEMERLIFPYQSSFTDNEGKHIQFTYVRQFLEEKLMFIAKADELTILIKFTRRYSEEAHRFCAERNLAPKLHAVERLAGGWMMVAMEYLDPEVYECVSCAPSNPVLLGKILQVVQILHSGGFVHGDVRRPNVMVSRTGAGASDVRLVDFDWAGREGETRYPPNLNHTVYPVGAEDRQTIKKEHDLAMVDRIFK